MSKPEDLKELKEGDRAPNFTFSDESGASNQLMGPCEEKKGRSLFLSSRFHARLY